MLKTLRHALRRYMPSSKVTWPLYTVVRHLTVTGPVTGDPVAVMFLVNAVDHVVRWPFGILPEETECVYTTTAFVDSNCMLNDELRLTAKDLAAERAVDDCTNETAAIRILTRSLEADATWERELLKRRAWREGSKPSPPTIENAEAVIGGIDFRVRASKTDPSEQPGERAVLIDLAEHRNKNTNPEKPQ